MVHEDLIWRNEQKSPLVFLIPGGAGTRRAKMAGYPASAGFFWLYGCSVYIAETSGQDGRDGVFSMKRSLIECEAALKEIARQLLPERVIIFGSCSGGAVATHLAASFPTDMLILWETLPKHDQTTLREWKAKSESQVRFAENFFDECLDTADAARKVTCPTHVLYGEHPSPNFFTKDHVDELGALFSNATGFEARCFPGADHSLTRGTNPRILGDVLAHVVKHLGLT